MTLLYSSSLSRFVQLWKIAILYGLSCVPMPLPNNRCYYIFAILYTTRKLRWWKMVTVITQYNLIVISLNGSGWLLWPNTSVLTTFKWLRYHLNTQPLWNADCPANTHWTVGSGAGGLFVDSTFCGHGLVTVHPHPGNLIPDINRWLYVERHMIITQQEIRRCLSFPHPAHTGRTLEETAIIPSHSTLSTAGTGHP